MLPVLVFPVGITTNAVGQPIEFPPVLSSNSNEVAVSLELARYLFEGPDSLKQYTRTYNGMMGGPTIRIKPGDTLKITMTNNLEDLYDTSALHNVYRDFDVTNMHTHGLHVPGVAPGDSVFTEVHPGETYTYTYEIPSNHMGEWHCRLERAPP
jgi:hypothetical protein